MTFKLVTWAVLLGLFTTQVACKRQQMKKSEVVVTGNDSTQVHTDGPVGKLTVKPAEVNFNNLKMKSKVVFSSPQLSQSFPATIQIKKDSIIWVSVAIGLEVARGIITPDSAIFLDRLNRNVYRFTFDELSEILQFDVSYDLLQSLFIGNMPFYIRENDVVSDDSNGIIIIKQRVGDLTLDNNMDQVVNKITQVIAQKSNDPNRLVINFGDFVDTEKGKFPQAVKMRVEQVGKGDSMATSIDIGHNKVEFLDSDLRFPFSVPTSYDEVKLKKK